MHEYEVTVNIPNLHLAVFMKHYLPVFMEYLSHDAKLFGLSKTIINSITFKCIIHNRCLRIDNEYSELLDKLIISYL